MTQHALYPADETLSFAPDIGKGQFAGVLLLVLLLHGVVFALWQRQKPHVKQTGNQTVVQVSLLPAADGASKKAMTDAALERAKIADKESKAKAQKRKSAVKPIKKNSAEKSKPKPKSQKKPIATPKPQPEPPVLVAQTRAQDKAEPLPLPIEPTQPVLEQTLQDEDDIDPMAVSGVEEVAPDAQPTQGEDQEKEEVFTDGEDDDTVLLPDMREAAGAEDTTQTVATATGGGEVTGEAGSTGTTDDDWLKTPAAPVVRRITPAEYASNPPPHYPALSRKLSEQGTVQIRAVVNAQGRVQSLRVTQSSGFGMLDNAAKKAVRGWRFEPRMENGKAVLSEVDVPVVFRLQ